MKTLLLNIGQAFLLAMIFFFIGVTVYTIASCEFHAFTPSIGRNIWMVLSVIISLIALIGINENKQ